MIIELSGSASEGTLLRAVIVVVLIFSGILDEYVLELCYRAALNVKKCLFDSLYYGYPVFVFLSHVSIAQLCRVQ